MRAFILHQFSDTGLTAVNRAIIAAILLSVVIFCLETYQPLYQAYQPWFVAMEKGFIALFALEYCCRLYAVGQNPAYQGLKGRLKYMITPIALVDLIAIAPSLIFSYGFDSLALRAARAFKLLRLAKLGRYTQASRLIERTVSAVKYELLISLALAFGLMIIGAVVLYLVEGQEQPEIFGSIPHALWWSMATLTTVGYGDVYPITALGKLTASVIALLGIGIVALPAGIIAGSFMSQIEEQKKSRQERKRKEEE